MAITSVDRPEDFYTDTIKAILVADVAKAMEADILPDMKKLIETYAEQAVAHWAVHMRSQKSMSDFGESMQIQIDFVEKVIRTEYVENPIKIKRKHK